MAENEERGLAIAGIVGLPVPIEEAVRQWQQYQELCRRLLGPEDMQRIGKREFRKKSGWRKLAKAFNITDKVIDSRIDKDEDGRVVSADFFVLAVAPNGRTAEGWGGCSIWERAHEEDKIDSDGSVTCKGPCNGRKHFSNADHDVPATAHTRAKNRAIADLIGAGEVSYDEVRSGGDPIQTTARAVHKKAEPITNPGSVVITFGKHKDKTIAEVWEEERGRDRTWLHWVKGLHDYKNQTVRQAAIQFLAEMESGGAKEPDSDIPPFPGESYADEAEAVADAFPQAEVKEVALSQEQKWSEGIKKLAKEQGHSAKVTEALLKQWADAPRSEERYQIARAMIEANAPKEE